MKRMVLLFGVVALVAAMVLINAVSGFAEEEWPPDEYPFDDGTDEPSFYEDYPPFYDGEPPFYKDEPLFYEDEPPFHEDQPPFYDDEPPFYEDVPPLYEDIKDKPVVEDVPDHTEPLCAPGWLQEWYPDWASGWWYFWWFQFCYTEDDGWYRMYDGWDWGYPMY